MEHIKILIAKPGLDGHDRGAKVVAKYLRDAGMEVIYTGLRQTPDIIASTAIQEDVDAIGLSILSGAHLQQCRKLLEYFKNRKIPPPPLFLGGIVPDEDIAELKKMGIAEVFPPGSSLEAITHAIKNHVLHH